MLIELERFSRENIDLFNTKYVFFVCVQDPPHVLLVYKQHRSLSSLPSRRAANKFTNFMIFTCSKRRKSVERKMFDTAEINGSLLL